MTSYSRNESRVEGEKTTTKMSHSGSCDDASQTVNAEENPQKLSDLLNCGWETFEEVDTTNEPIGSNDVQVKIIRGIKVLEDLTRMVAQLDLFSRNELLEEVATTDLKYLVLPALLGGLNMKLTTRDKRLAVVSTAREHFHGFLRRCKEYNVSDFKLPKSATETDDESKSGSSTTKSTTSNGPPDLVAMAAQRQAKIERYRQKKMTEDRLLEVKKAVDSEKADDELIREFYILTVKKWINIALEEIDSIDQELEILKGMDILSEPSQHHKQPPRQPMKPFVLTKDAVQARVFGAGYPSLPTMTVDDWYEQHQKHGALPDQGIPRRVAPGEDDDNQEHEDEVKEKRVEEDEEEALQKARDWDDWKDSHRRGYGNRKNMG